MTKKNTLQKLFTFASLCLFTASSHAAFVLNSTRYVFDEKERISLYRLITSLLRNMAGKYGLKTRIRTIKTSILCPAPLFLKWLNSINKSCVF